MQTWIGAIDKMSTERQRKYQGAVSRQINGIQETDLETAWKHFWPGHCTWNQSSRRWSWTLAWDGSRSSTTGKQRRSDNKPALRWWHFVWSTVPIGTQRSYTRSRPGLLFWCIKSFGVLRWRALRWLCLLQDWMQPLWSLPWRNWRVLVTKEVYPIWSCSKQVVYRMESCSLCHCYFPGENTNIKRLLIFKLTIWADHFFNSFSPKKDFHRTEISPKTYLINESRTRSKEKNPRD